MKKCFLFILFFCTTTSLFAQDKKVSVDGLFGQMTNMEDNGMVLKTYKTINKKGDKEWTLTRYDTDLNKIWTVNQPTFIKGGSWGTDIVATVDGSYVYHIRKGAVTTNFEQLKRNVTQINASGEVKEKELYKNEKMEAVDHQFATSDFLCFVSTDYDLKSSTVTLYTLDHKDLSFKVIRPVMPKLETYGPWRYCGQYKDNMYFYKKIFDKRKSALSEYHIAKIDLQGRVVNTLILKVELPTNFVQEDSENYPDMDIFDGNVRNDYTIGRDSNIPVPRANAYGSVRIDEVNGSLYLYGLIKHIKARIPAGFFIHKYDMEGKKIWQENKIITSGPDFDKLFAKSFNTRKTFFRIDPKDTSIIFKIISLKNAVTYEISSDGKVDGYSFSQYKSILITQEEVEENFGTKIIENSKALTYKNTIDMTVEKGSVFFYYKNSNSEIISIDRQIADKSELLLFKR